MHSLVRTFGALPGVIRCGFQQANERNFLEQSLTKSYMSSDSDSLEDLFRYVEIVT